MIQKRLKRTFHRLISCLLFQMFLCSSNGNKMHYAFSSSGNWKGQIRLFYSDKNILNANFNFFKIFGCRLIAGQQISNRTNSNSIRKETKCDKYVKDQLNVAGKNLIRLMKKMKINILTIFALCTAGLAKSYFKLFFVAQTNCFTEQISKFSDPSFTCKQLRKYLTKFKKPNIHSKI